MANMGRRSIRSCKCWLHPNGAQEAALPDMPGHFRDLCNAGLQQRIEAWNRQGASLRHTDQARPRRLRRAQARTPRLQRALARKARNSKRRAKARRNLARHHGRVAAARRDFLHRLSHGQASRHRVIAMEDLGMNALERSLLARSVHDAAWTRLRDMLGNKAASAGG